MDFPYLDKQNDFSLLLKRGIPFWTSTRRVPRYVLIHVSPWRLVFGNSSDFFPRSSRLGGGFKYFSSSPLLLWLCSMFQTGWFNHPLSRYPFWKKKEHGGTPIPTLWVPGKHKRPIWSNSPTVSLPGSCCKCLGSRSFHVGTWRLRLVWNPVANS